MSTPRHPKRQRKKEAAAARRAALAAEMERRRRKRTVLLLSTVGALVVGGAAIAFGVSLAGRPEPTPSAKPTPSLAPSPAPIACGARLPEASGSKKESYAAAEDQKLERKKTYVWRLETSCGTVDVKLAHTKAPQTANSIVFLTRKGFFGGLTFHRLVTGFVIQGGDPLGTGTGGSGYKVTEAPPAGAKYTRGVVAMAKGGAEAAGTSGSQFFIVVGEDAGLPAEYAIVGDVVAGMDVADKIAGYAGGGPGQESPPKAKVFIEKASVIEQ